MMHAVGNKRSPEEYLRMTNAINMYKMTFKDAKLTLSYPGGAKYAPSSFFLHHPKTAQGITLKTHFASQTSSLSLSCCQGNKITEGTSQDLAPKKSEKSAICRDIELKFGIETIFGSLSSKTIVKLQCDVIMMFLAFRPFCR